MRRYHSDEHVMDLDTLQERLKCTDLIPSQEPLLDGMADTMAALGKAGVTSMADLRSALKTKTSLAALSEVSGVPAPYLQLLKRTVNGFFPKPRALQEIDWLDEKAIARLNEVGLKNTKQLFEAASDDKAGLIEKTGVERSDLDDLLTIAGLCRIQWVAPTFARVLVAAGYQDAAAIAKADPDALFQSVVTANAGAKFYKGKVGLRDMRRLVAAAGYVP